MSANYHTHTPRCNHAVGSEREYVQKALEAGLTILGFSDHTPYLFPGDYYSTFRMHPQELSGYVAAVESLKTEFAGSLEIHIGLEAEFYPAYFPKTLDFLREAGVEYLLLGQHFIGNEPYGSYSGRETTDESILEGYCRQVIAAMDTGAFTYIAHPDIIHFVGPQTIYRKWMGTLVREAKDHQIPLELNLLGLRENRNYPNSLFLELVAEENLPMVLGYDAHQPDHLTNTVQLTQAEALLNPFGIRLLPTVELKPI